MDTHGSNLMARYVNIAVDIATRVVRGEYRVGQKIFGRSTLAGKYNVSPETIRRALTLLQDTGIVQVSPGVGVVVKSQKAAEAFLAECGQKQVLRDVQEKLQHLLKERDKINLEIEKLMNELLDYTFKMAGRLQRIEEIKVLGHSPLVGKSLAEAEFRGKTGATVLAIYRNGEEIFSPSAETVIQTGDILIVVAQPEMRDQVHQLLEPLPSENL
ncbi:MAG: GntR family transcriptional regulator [Peptococcaceae bacterium BRH_c4b]|nr:MAG: GntR family transcriptional regulator [Peptococcaceae bacterium BRH_c4b]